MAQVNKHKKFYIKPLWCSKLLPLRNERKGKETKENTGRAGRGDLRFGCPTGAYACSGLQVRAFPVGK